jgi:hypothetical protein
MRGTAKGLMWAVITAATLALAACNPVANLNAADSQIAKIHAAYSRGNAGAIYAMTGPQFRASFSRAQMDELVDVLNVRLGAIKSSERTSFNVNTTPAGTFTTITMSTQFAKGDGQEDFVFSGKGDDMKLEGWHVQSPRLMLTADDIADERGDAVPAPVMMVAPPPNGAPDD